MWLGAIYLVLQYISPLHISGPILAIVGDIPAVGDFLKQ